MDLLDFTVYNLPGGYKLGLDYAGRKGDYHSRVRYVLQHEDQVIFQGDDYGVPSHQTCDDASAAIGLLVFLTLQPGDTDSEYFDGYTQSQLDWAASDDAENIRALCNDFEEGRGAEEYDDKTGETRLYFKEVQ